MLGGRELAVDERVAGRIKAAVTLGFFYRSHLSLSLSISLSLLENVNQLDGTLGRKQP